MITNGFTYIAVLVFIAALLVWLQRYTKSNSSTMHHLSFCCTSLP